MSTDQDIARRLRTWLREHGDDDPGPVVDRVLDRIDWIPQRRPGWLARRFTLMKDNRIRFGIAAAVVLVAAFLGMRFLPTDGGGLGAGEIPESAFTSERHHYVLMFPDDSWLMIERDGEWTPGVVFNESSPGLDVADKIGEDQPYVLLASQPLDVDPDEWLERYDVLVEEAFPQCPLESSETRTVDGEEARISSYDCGGAGSDGVEAIIFHDARAYALRVFDEDPSYDPRPLLDEFLDVFRFAD